MGKPEEDMAEKLLRFKDVLKMEGKDAFSRPLELDDLHVTNYMPGEDPLVNYRAYRRKRTIGVGEGGPIGESTDVSRHIHAFELTDDVDEALSVQQRLARKRLLQRIKPKLKRGRDIAKRRIASKEKLEKRARKQARMMIFKKLTKDLPKSELTYARRQEIEKRLDTPAMKKRIGMIARKLFPKVRKAELEKKTKARSAK